MCLAHMLRKGNTQHFRSKHSIKIFTFWRQGTLKQEVHKRGLQKGVLENSHMICTNWYFHPHTQIAEAALHTISRKCLAPDGYTHHLSLHSGNRPQPTKHRVKLCLYLLNPSTSTKKWLPLHPAIQLQLESRRVKKKKKKKRTGASNRANQA